MPKAVGESIEGLSRQSRSAASDWRRSADGWAGEASDAGTVLGPSWSTRGTDPGLNRAAVWPVAWPSIRAVAPGRVLGPYRLIERVGRGRQADVWRARRRDGGSPDVALKVLPACRVTQDPRRLAQLRHEAERGTRLVGPSLLTAFDFGEADGLVFLAMPLVVGCTLGAVIHQRRSCLAGSTPGPETHTLATAADADYHGEVVRMVAGVARAVAAAHAALIVHRDIKPMNILVSRDPGHGRPGESPADPAAPRYGVFLCDFGLARDLDVATPGQLRDGAGSPLYMAPERLRRQDADEVRCDVYALGVTLFEALTLSPPVELPFDLPQIRWADHLADAPPRRARDLAPGLTPALEAVVHRAMDRDPERRQPSAGRLADDLQGCLEGLLKRSDSADPRRAAS